MSEELLFADESYAIRGAIYEVYKTLGAGYLEEVYQNALEEELSLRKIPFEAKKRCRATGSLVLELCSRRLPAVGESQRSPFVHRFRVGGCRFGDFRGRIPSPPDTSPYHPFPK